MFLHVFESSWICWLNISLKALYRLPLFFPLRAWQGRRYLAASCGTQPVSVQTAELTSNTAFIPSPCWNCLACCRGHSRDSSPSPGWEGTEVIPCQLWLDQGENNWECGCCTLQLCSHEAPSISVHAESIENLSNEGKQLYSVLLTTEGVQVQFKQQQQESLQQRLYGVWLEQLPWVKHIDYKKIHAQ